MEASKSQERRQPCATSSQPHGTNIASEQNPLSFFLTSPRRRSFYPLQLRLRSRDTLLLPVSPVSASAAYIRRYATALPRLAGLDRRELEPALSPSSLPPLPLLPFQLWGDDWLRLLLSTRFLLSRRSLPPPSNSPLTFRSPILIPYLNEHHPVRVSTSILAFSLTSPSSAQRRHNVQGRAQRQKCHKGLLRCSSESAKW